MDELNVPVNGVDVPGPAVGEAASTGADLVLAISAVPGSLSTARRRLRGWLDDLRWPEPEADDILLAVGEALANVVDHAYPPGEPGTASLHAWPTADVGTDGRRVVVTVIDRGRWAAHHPQSPAPELRGRGLAMMRACVAELHVQPSAAGTTVIMVSSAVPPDDA